MNFCALKYVYMQIEKFSSRTKLFPISIIEQHWRKAFFVLIKAALWDVQQKVHVAAREQQLEVTKKAKNDIAVLLTALGVDFSCQSHFRFDKQTQQSGRFIKFFATELRAHFRATTSFACARSYYILYANSNGACVVEHLQSSELY